MPPTRPKVLLIGWDAADWQHITPLLDAGLMPTLNGLVDAGVIGNLATLQPVLSPMLWTSIATGKHAYKHGIHGFIEADPDHGGARPYSSTSRTAHALWNLLSREGLRCNVVNWWASHPAEPVRGCVISNAFAGVRRHRAGYHTPRGAVHPADKAQLYAQFKVFPTDLTAEHLLPFIPRAAELDQDEDSRLQTLANVLSETATTQAVATAVMELEPWDFMAVYFTGIDHFSHGFMAYHPPRQSHIPEADFELFKDVITGAYRFHDMILERLLHLAGPDTTVILCSDHGFQSRDLRPLGVTREPAGPAVWHRRFGVLVAKGPGIRRDERVYGATLVDIAPTILTLFGLPVGDDMDGRPLVEMFETPPRVTRIPTWEGLEGDFGTHRERPPIDRDDAEQLMRQFVALGYLDDPGGDKDKQAESARTEATYNLALNLLWRRQFDLAVERLEDLVRRYPWESRFIEHLAVAYQRAGRSQQAMRLIEASYDLATTPSASARMTWALAAIDSGNHAAALTALRSVEQIARARRPALFQTIGEAYRRLRQWADAERAFRIATDVDADDAEAHQGLAIAHRRQGRYTEAIDAALTAVGLVFRLPLAHLNLGIALARTGETPRAVFALETALKFDPDNLAAHRWLVALYRSRANDPAKAAHHRIEVARLRATAAATRSARRDQRAATSALPVIPTEAERVARIVAERPDRPDPRRRSGKSFVIVSGLPRSGTSLMMQMLEAGGLPARTDGERTADDDNPRGYYEWEAIKQVGARPELLDEDGLEAKAIKVVSMLLDKLPYNHEYKVIFMLRPVAEVVASQARMIEHRATEGAALEPGAIERGLATHRAQALAFIRRNTRMSCLEIDYPGLVADPRETIGKLVEFLGAERLPHPERMRAVVDASLYRRRSP